MLAVYHIIYTIAVLYIGVVCVFDFNFVLSELWHQNTGVSDYDYRRIEMFKSTDMYKSLLGHRYIKETPVLSN